MMHIRFKKHNEGSLLYMIFIIFIITELIDDFLDHILGMPSIFHSILQLLLFIILFYIVSKIFYIFYKRRINRLIPEELMNILKIIKEAEIKGILINQRNLRTRLNITKPTLKKKLDNLLDLQYIFFEEKGNNKYLKLTPLGDSILY